MNSGSAGELWTWLRLRRTWDDGLPSASATAARSRPASATLVMQRSTPISATLLSPSPSTSTVAVRSLSIAWIGAPNSRSPGHAGAELRIDRPTGGSQAYHGVVPIPFLP